MVDLLNDMNVAGYFLDMIIYSGIFIKYTTDYIWYVCFDNHWSASAKLHVITYV